MREGIVLEFCRLRLLRSVLFRTCMFGIPKEVTVPEDEEEDDVPSVQTEKLPG